MTGARVDTKKPARRLGGSPGDMCAAGIRIAAIILRIPHEKLCSCWWSVARQWLVTLGEALCQEGREKYSMPLS